MTANETDKKRNSLPLAYIIVVLAIVIVSAIIYTEKERFEPVVRGRNAPDFKLPDLEGGLHALSNFKGKVIFLNFWATWCKPCEEEMPSMQVLYNELKGKDFEMLAVSVDTKGAEVVRKFVKKYGITFPVLLDRKGRVKELYKTTGVPETFIIDQNGIIAEKVWGPRDWTMDVSTAMIRDLLKNGPKSPNEYKMR